MDATPNTIDLCRGAVLRSRTGDEKKVLHEGAHDVRLVTVMRDTVEVQIKGEYFFVRDEDIEREA